MVSDREVGWIVDSFALVCSPAPPFCSARCAQRVVFFPRWAASSVWLVLDKGVREARRGCRGSVADGKLLSGSHASSLAAAEPSQRRGERVRPHGKTSPLLMFFHVWAFSFYFSDD